MIEVVKLNKSFGELHVLKDIDLTIYDREVVCLIGASGSGKSTLLRCLNFLEMKDGGDILIDGEEIDIKTHDLNAVRQKVGMVFQHFHLFPHKTVLENVMEAPLYVKKRPKEEVKEEARSLLEKVGLLEKEHGLPTEVIWWAKAKGSDCTCLSNEAESDAV